ncbi:hypothetical protein CPB85DRAFT_870659 [Mucidula mucida]|nr:hypothetical protein CPB85DRAFT_870659 [Mucidula mucida]
MSEDELTLLTEPFIPMLSAFDDPENASFSPWLRLLISCNNLFVKTSVNIDITDATNRSLFVLQRYTVRCLRAERFWGADSTKQERRAIFRAMQSFIASNLFVQMHDNKELRGICDTAITVCSLLLRHDRRIFPASSRDWHNPSFLKNLVRRLKITQHSEDSSIHVPDRIVVSLTLAHALRQAVNEACELFMEEDLLQLLGGYFPKYNKENEEAIEAARAAIGVAVGAYIVAVRNSFLSGWEWTLSTALPDAHMHLRYLHQRENLYQAFLSLVMSYDVSDYRLHALAHIWPHSSSLWTEYRRRGEARKLSRYKIREFKTLLRSSEGGGVIRCSVLDAECSVTPLDHALGSCQLHTVLERSIAYMKILRCVFTKHEEADAKQLLVFQNITAALASAVPGALPWGAGVSVDIGGLGDLDVRSHS